MLAIKAVQVSKCALLFEIKCMIKQNQSCLLESAEEKTNESLTWIFQHSPFSQLNQALIRSFIKTAFIAESGTECSRGFQSTVQYTTAHVVSYILKVIYLSIATILKVCVWFSMRSVFSLLLFRNF